jgi:ubiquitin-conjugating enzyme E2 M
MSRLARGSRSTTSARDFRLQKDLDEIHISELVGVSFPDRNDHSCFVVQLRPDTGMWKSGKFDFEFKIPPDWPIEAPRLRLLTRTWHPNVTEEGQVCLNLLKETYTPVMTIDHLIAGLQFLFMEPCAISPLNVQAAKMYQRDMPKFQETVDEYIRRYCPGRPPDDIVPPEEEEQLAGAAKEEETGKDSIPCEVGGEVSPPGGTEQPNGQDTEAVAVEVDGDLFPPDEGEQPTGQEEEDGTEDKLI